VSTKFQITLPEPLMVRLKRESDRLHVSTAELIRQTMEDRLKSPRPSKRDPFEAIDCLVRSDETDLAAHVDEYLYG